MKLWYRKPAQGVVEYCPLAMLAWEQWSLVALNMNEFNSTRKRCGQQIAEIRKDNKRLPANPLEGKQYLSKLKRVKHTKFYFVKRKLSLPIKARLGGRIWP